MSKEAFNNAPATGGARRETDTVPDGQYDLKVVAFFVNEKNGVYYGKAGLEVATGLLRGKFIEVFDALEGRGAQWFRTFLTIAAARSADRLPTWDDIFDAETGRTGPIRREVLGAVVACKVATNRGRTKDFVNVFVNTLVTPNGQQQSNLDDLAGDDSDDSSTSAPPPAPPAEVVYHHWSSAGDEQREDLTMPQLLAAIAEAPTADHRVWQRGWSGDWKSFEDVPEIVAAMAKASPPAPPKPKQATPPPTPKPATDVPYSDDEDIPF